MREAMASDSAPKVSVVMAVYNGERYVRQAVESVLAQTFRDFEFIILDDGSTDGTLGILREFDDPRIRIIRNERNEGLTRCLIKGCGEARGKYVARMDADDVSYPERFKKQVEFLEANEEYALVGTWCEYIDSDGRARKVCGYPCSDEAIREDIWVYNPFAHASIMFVREAIEKSGGYRELFRYSQDYDLWFRVLEKYKGANLGERLHGFRYHRASITFQRLHLQNCFADLAREFARMRQETGADLIVLGAVAETEARIRSWLPKGLGSRMNIRSECALQLLDFMVSWGKVSDLFALWVAAVCNNPANRRVWRFLFSSPFRGRLRTGLRHRLFARGTS
jgi:hypothetical protein